MIKNNLEDIQRQARKLIDKHGLKDWTFEFFNGKQVHGKANLQQKRIAISRIHAQYEQNNKAVIDTILHEIDHALDFKQRRKSNHDKHWKHIAKTIGSIPTSRGYVESTIPYTKKELSKWLGECPNCGMIYYRNRRRYVACGKCCKNDNKGKFSKRYLLDYQPNPDYIII